MKYGYLRRVGHSGLSARIRVFLCAALCLGILPTALMPAGSGAVPGLTDRQVCSKSISPSAAFCLSRVLAHARNGRAFSTTSYTSGLMPQQLWDAYKLPSAYAGNFLPNGQTIALVDAYDNPNAANDLLVYRQRFNLPLCNDGGVGCLFRKVNQGGFASPLPSGNTSWGQESDLDIEVASAICPDCNVLLIEANSSSFSDLGIAEDTAVALGANSVSNSWGGSEFSSETSSTYDGHFNHKGVAITASAGDSGYGVTFPAASLYVTAVGGTSLKQDSSVARGWTETAWSGTGGGCSAYVTQKPAGQPVIGSCTRRIVSDVSAVADPYTGVAVYDSYGSSSGANWYVFGGTSVASPIIAGVYALAGNAGGASPSIGFGEYPYAHSAALFDVSSGSNGRCTTRWSVQNRALCTAISGYDGPTGLGSPHGTNAF